MFFFFLKLLKIQLKFAKWILTYPPLYIYYKLTERFVWRINSNSGRKKNMHLRNALSLCWRRSSRGLNCWLTHELDLGSQGSLPHPVLGMCSAHPLRTRFCPMCCWDQLCDWTQLRPLHKHFLRFWGVGGAGAKIYSSHISSFAY